MTAGTRTVIAGVVFALAAAMIEAALMRLDIVGPWLIWGTAAVGIFALVASRPAQGWLDRDLASGLNFGAAAGWALAAGTHIHAGYFFVWIFAVITLVPTALLAAATNAIRAVDLMRDDNPRRVLMALGVLVALLVPLALQVAEAQWLGRVLPNLSDRDPHKAALALRAINTYPLRLGRFAYDVCDRVVRGPNDWSADQALATEVRTLLGPHPEGCESRDPHG